MHARFARGGFSTMIFPIKEMATPPVKIHWWKNHILPSYMKRWPQYR
ncbi:MAG TPA: hypothetical protein VJI98_03290 [Candidatus Nanoarchaeia archaeon]|nr:hypothetical protein [Candidatus Nanoarchaeia archaeon]